MTIEAIFPKPLGKFFLEPSEGDVKKLKEETFAESFVSLVAATPNKHILGKYPHLVKSLGDLSKQFLAEGLGEETTDYIITTSWVTRTQPNGQSQIHRHCNCLYSGVWFFDDYEEGVGNFELHDPYMFHKDFLVLPEKETAFMPRLMHIKPERGLLIIFPSYLYHQIGLNKSSQVRYSLAFNLMPTGQIGGGDSDLRLLKIM